MTNIRAKVILALAAFFILPVILFAQETPEERDAYLEGYLNTLTTEDIPAAEEIPAQLPVMKKASPVPSPEEKTSAIEKALRNLHIELAMEYIGFVNGKQTFEVIDEAGQRISRLSYPHSGGMWFLKGEVRLLPRLSVGGRYGNSNFKKTTCTDTDWIPAIATDRVWNESNSDSDIKIELYDINLYLRLLDFDKENTELGSSDMAVLNDWMVDKLSVDVFSGYQKQEGRYGMTNLVDTVENYQTVGIPYNSLNSFYKIKYYGPRLGLRAGGSRGKFSSSLSFAYSWLSTDAFGWWNLRNYPFWQKGKNGYGMEAEVEVAYQLTSHFSAGLGFNYISLRQKNMTESGYNSNTPFYKDLDIIRNANSDIYGPSVILKYIW